MSHANSGLPLTNFLFNFANDSALHPRKPTWCCNNVFVDTMNYDNETPCGITPAEWNAMVRDLRGAITPAEPKLHWNWARIASTQGNLFEGIIAYQMFYQMVWTTRYFTRAAGSTGAFLELGVDAVQQGIKGKFLLKSKFEADLSCSYPHTQHHNAKIGYSLEWLTFVGNSVGGFSGKRVAQPIDDEPAQGSVSGAGVSSLPFLSSESKMTQMSAEAQQNLFRWAQSDDLEEFAGSEA